MNTIKRDRKRIESAARRERESRREAVAAQIVERVRAGTIPPDLATLIAEFDSLAPRPVGRPRKSAQPT